MNRKAFAQIPLMIGLLIMAIAVPVATKLVQTNQENRGKAMGDECTSNVDCGTGYHCTAGFCVKNGPTATTKPTNTTAPNNPTATKTPTNATATKTPTSSCAFGSCSINGSTAKCVSGYYFTCDGKCWTNKTICASGSCDASGTACSTVSPTATPTCTSILCMGTPTLTPTATLTPTLKAGQGYCDYGPNTESACKAKDPGAPCGTSGGVCTWFDNSGGKGCSCFLHNVCCRSNSSGIYSWEVSCSSNQTVVNDSYCSAPTATPTKVAACSATSGQYCANSIESCTNAGNTVGNGSCASGYVCCKNKSTTTTPVPTLACNSETCILNCATNGKKASCGNNGICVCSEIPTIIPTDIPNNPANPTATPTIKATVIPTDKTCNPFSGTKATLNDFSIWRSEYVEGSYGSISRSTWQTDFDCDNKVSLNDYSVWRENYIKSL